MRGGAAPPVRLDEPPPGLRHLRQRCIASDGVDPFQHTPPFDRDPKAESPAYYAVSGNEGPAGFGALWGSGVLSAVTVVDPDMRRAGTGAALGDAIEREASVRNARVVVGWVAGAGRVTDRYCDRWQGMVDRRLFKLAVGLPLGPAPEIPAGYRIRPYEPADADAVVRLNKEAFAGLADQAGMTVDDIRASEGEDWFDASGFLLAFEGDELAGFCWTKLHTEVETPEGEIYVICTSPKHQGRGLGRTITSAGFAHLSTYATKGMLYVDESNLAARRTYRSLGMRPERVDAHFRFELGTPARA